MEVPVPEEPPPPAPLGLRADDGDPTIYDYTQAKYAITDLLTELDKLAKTILGPTAEVRHTHRSHGTNEDKAASVVGWTKGSRPVAYTTGILGVTAISSRRNV
ncbi:MAG: hypothetical protein WBA45_16790 [Microthrixaceae bacterium]